MGTGSKSKIRSALKMLSALPMSKQNKNQNKPKQVTRSSQRIETTNELAKYALAMELFCCEL